MSTAIALITDGRTECMARTVASLQAAWHGALDEVVIIDDSADVHYRDWLESGYPTFRQVHHDERRGFAGAIQSAWAEVGHHDYVFHLEDDFLFTEPLNIGAMRMLLDERPELQQVALKRQPWGSEGPGGFMGDHPEHYHDEVGPGGISWCWQRLFFTTNPSLYRGSLTGRGWPDGPDSEQRFSNEVLADPATKFGYLGWSVAPPRVEHIGRERVGRDY